MALGLRAAASGSGGGSTGDPELGETRGVLRTNGGNGP